MGGITPTTPPSALQTPNFNSRNQSKDEKHISKMAISQLLLQFFLVALTFAQPIAIETTQENAWKYGTSGGVIGFAVLILDIIVFGTSSSSSFLSIPGTLSLVLLALPSPFCRPLLLPNFPSKGKDRSKGGKLTICSRGPQIQPPSRPQAPLAPARLPLPHRWIDHLLVVFEPGCP